MGRINVTRAIEADADALWGCVRDFGGVGWMPGGENAEIEGEGPGMKRIFAGPNGKIHEVLESVDDASRTIVYTIPEGVPFPVTGYRATMTCSGSELSWTCEFEPEGVGEEEAGKIIEGMYGTMMGWIEDFLKG